MIFMLVLKGTTQVKINQLKINVLINLFTMNHLLIISMPKHGKNISNQKPATNILKTIKELLPF